MVFCGLFSQVWKRYVKDKGGTEDPGTKDGCSHRHLEHPDINIICVTFILLAYLIAGAFIFCQIEEQTEAHYRASVRVEIQLFLQRHPEVAPTELQSLIQKIVDATQKGVNPSRNVSMEANWGFGQSFFFAGTLISTVGYGHVSPLTSGGKAFTIVYACLGIPLTLTLLTALVERLKMPSIWFLGKLNRRLGHLWQPIQIRFFHLALIFAGFLLFLFVIPAAFFTAIETDWSYLDAFYYCFISLTTIGLGDYIPGDKPGQKFRAIYKVVATVYLLVGLCCMMLLLATIYDIPQLNLSNIFLVKADDTNDPEKLLLAEQTGPMYSKQVDDASPDSPPSSLGQHTPAESYYQINSGKK